MAVKDKDKSLLEIAIELLQKKRKPQKLLTIVAEVMEIKGYKTQLAKEHTAQFLLDFMQSGYFVYCGDDCWDLKERQSTSILDKDGGDYEEIFYDDEDVKNNELKDDMFDQAFEKADSGDDSDDDNDDDEDDDDDDIARELSNFGDGDEEDGITEIENEHEEEEEEDDLTDEDFK